MRSNTSELFFWHFVILSHYSNANWAISHLWQNAFLIKIIFQISRKGSKVNSVFRSTKSSIHITELQRSLRRNSALTACFSVPSSPSWRTFHSNSSLPRWEEASSTVILHPTRVWKNLGGKRHVLGWQIHTIPNKQAWSGCSYSEETFQATKKNSHCDVLRTIQGPCHHFSSICHRAWKCSCHWHMVGSTAGNTLKE